MSIQQFSKPSWKEKIRSTPIKTPIKGMKLSRAGVIGGVIDGAIDFAIRRSENPDGNIGVQFMQSAMTATAWAVAPTLMWGVTALELANGAGKMMTSAKRAAYESQFAEAGRLGVIGGNFNETGFTYTSRQRAMQAIQSSRLNVRSALGGEAKSLHRF